MASTFTTGFGIEKIGSGEQSGTWGTTTNHNFDIIDRIASYKAVAITTNADTATLTVREASPGSGTENLQDGMYRVIKFTGALDSNCTVTIAPNTAPAWFIIENATTDSGSSGPYSLILSQGSGANVTVQNGKNAIIYCDGAGSGAAVVDALADLQIGTLEVTGAAAIDGALTLGGAVTGATNITLSGELDAATLDISGNADIDGTTNLDAVDIDGAVQADGTITVGVDDTGYDVKFFGATSGKYMLWDESADSLKVLGKTLVGSGATGSIGGSLEVILGATGTIATFGGASGDELYVTNRASGKVGLTTNSADDLEFKSNTVSFIDQSNAAGNISVGSLFATDIKLGEDNSTKIDFGTADEINFYANNAIPLTITQYGVVVNQAGAAGLDFTVESQYSNQALFLDAGAGTLAANVSSATFSGDVKLGHDGAVLYFGADNDISLTHTADVGLTLNGVLDIYRSVSGGTQGTYAQITNSNNATNDVASLLFGVTNNTATSASYHKAGIHFKATGSSNIGQLILSANADNNATASSTSDAALTIEGSDKSATFAGAVQHNSTVTVGVNDTGYDVKFFGATSGKYMLWDESADVLHLPDNTKLRLGDLGDCDIYHDNTNTLIQNGTGDFIIDAASDIILDADGGDVIFKDGGTAIGTFANNSNNLRIVSNVSDADIILRGVDGGSAIDAVTVDMSDAGTAIFNHDVNATTAGSKFIFGHSSYLNTGTSDYPQIHYSNKGNTLLLAEWSATNASEPTLRFLKSASSTIGTNTLVADDENLGAISFNAADGTDLFSIAAKITAFVDGTPGAGDIPGRLEFATTADGSDSPTTRMLLNSAGELSIGGGSNLNVANHFTVDVASNSRYVRLTLDNNSSGAKSYSVHSIGDGDSANGSFGIYNDTGNAWVLKIDGNGNASLGGGLGFNDETAAANLLDDYEEGTWTPTLTGETTAGTGQGYTSQVGRYTKIGRIVHVQIHLDMSSIGTAAGVMNVSLPITSANVGCGWALPLAQKNEVDIPSNKSWLTGYVKENSAIMLLQSHGDAVGSSALNATDLDDPFMMQFSGSYEAA